MRAGRFNGRRIVLPLNQRGVVLLIALIILVAMTLAGIGMMRSVDTGNVIAGNLAFRQSTLNASDRGTSDGFNNVLALLAGSGVGPANALNSDDSSRGYYSTVINNAVGNYDCDVTSSCAAGATPWWAIDANWTNNARPAISVPVLDSNGSQIANVRYLIDRLCVNANANLIATRPSCAMNVDTGCSKSNPPQPCYDQVLYRITSRSDGTRNTVTYTQTLVSIAQTR